MVTDLIRATPEEDVIRRDIYDRPPIFKWTEVRAPHSDLNYKIGMQDMQTLQASDLSGRAGPQFSCVKNNQTRAQDQ